MLRRAVDEEGRQPRRASILEAARMLFNRNDQAIPTAAEVAKAAGLAKGTLYLYFKTKEEIFANLLLEGWLPVMQATELVFRESKGRRSEQVRAFVISLVCPLRAHPELLRLDALGAGVLEKNMTPNALAEYKQRFNRGLEEAGECIDRAFRLQSGRGLQILMRTYAMTRGLWQTAQHGEAVRTRGTGNSHRPGNFHTAATSTFLAELAEAVAEYWHGALAAKRDSLRAGAECSSPSAPARE